MPTGARWKWGEVDLPNQGPRLHPNKAPALSGPPVCQAVPVFPAVLVVPMVLPGTSGRPWVPLVLAVRMVLVLRVARVLQVACLRHDIYICTYGSNLYRFPRAVACRIRSRIRFGRTFIRIQPTARDCYWYALHREDGSSNLCCAPVGVKLGRPIGLMKDVPSLYRQLVTEPWRMCYVVGKGGCLGVCLRFKVLSDGQASDP